MYPHKSLAEQPRLALVTKLNQQKENAMLIFEEPATMNIAFAHNIISSNTDSTIDDHDIPGCCAELFNVIVLCIIILLSVLISIA